MGPARSSRARALHAAPLVLGLCGDEFCICHRQLDTENGLLFILFADLGRRVPNSILIVRQHVDDHAVFRLAFISAEGLQFDCVAREPWVEGGLDVAETGSPGVLCVQEIQPVLLPASQQR